MDAKKAVPVMLHHAGLSAYKASLKLGKVHSYLSGPARGQTVQSLQTVADVGGVCGVDVVLVDRATGETLGRVDPSPRETRE